MRNTTAMGTLPDAPARLGFVRAVAGAGTAGSTVLAGLIAPVRVEFEAVAVVRTMPSRQAQGCLPSSAI